MITWKGLRYIVTDAKFARVSRPRAHNFVHDFLHFQLYRNQNIYNQCKDMPQKDFVER